MILLLDVGGVDNPDHRITTDVTMFAEKVVDLVPKLARPSLEIIFFTYQLTQVLGWQGPAFLYGYFALSAVVKRVLMPSLAVFVAKESEMEGMSRFPP